MRRAPPLVLFALAAACGGAGAPGPEVRTLAADPTPYASGTNRAPGPSNAAPAGAAPSGATGIDAWPQTPMTAFAREMTALALAALEGRELPDSPIPLSPRAGEQPRMSLESGATLAPPLRLLCFFVEVGVAFARPQTPGDDQNVELGVLLCATGVRIVELDRDPSTPGSPLPPRAAGLAQVVTEAIEAFVEGRGEELLLGERDRAAMGGDPLYSLAIRESVRPDQLPRLQQMLAQRGPPVGYALDDLGVIASDGRGAVGLTLDADTSPAGIVLGGPPLVRVRRMER